MQKLRNIAIIAHVDHGKTTLVDKMIVAGHLLRGDNNTGDLIMDNNDLERERGITILSKNMSVIYKDYKINIIDTPGHADFGGEVERVLNMCDGVLLLVDAFEGTMPQTRFVLQKALSLGKKPIVVINKVDKPNCRPEVVNEQVFDLMFSLNATEEQLDYKTIYGSAKQGWMSHVWNEPTDSITPLLEAIIDEIPAPEVAEGTPQMLITSLEYSPYVGRIAVGKITRGELRAGQNVTLAKRDGEGAITVNCHEPMYTNPAMISYIYANRLGAYVKTLPKTEFEAVQKAVADALCITGTVDKGADVDPIRDYLVPKEDCVNLKKQLEEKETELVLSESIRAALEESNKDLHVKIATYKTYVDMYHDLLDKLITKVGAVL